MGGDTPDMPQQSPAAAAASAAQSDALATQTQLLKSQLNMQNLLAPVLFDKLGLVPTKDGSGQITGFTQKADPNKALNDQVQSLTLGRELSALKGDLPIDPQLSQELDRQEQQLHDQLRSSLGDDYASSTPGQQAIQDFNQRKANVVASAARGDITSLGGLANQNTATGQQTVDQQIAMALGIGEAPTQNLSLFNGIAQNEGTVVSSDNTMRTNQFQAEQQSSDSMFSGIGSLFGTVAGAFLGGPGGAALGSSIGSSLFGGGSSGLAGSPSNPF